MYLAQKITITSHDSGVNLKSWLEKNYPTVAYSTIAKLIRQKDIKIIGVSTTISTILEEGMVLRLPPSFANRVATITKPKKLSSNKIDSIRSMVIYEDRDVFVVNKPCFLAVQGGNKIKNHLDALLVGLQQDGKEIPKLVHRLDKDTSGVLLLAKNKEIAKVLTSDFATKQVDKTYLAVVCGIPNKEFGIIEAPLSKITLGGEEKVRVNPDGKPAKTKYTLLASFENKISILQLQPLTGRTHQLRVHCSEILKTPIVGDHKYGYTESYLTNLKLDKRLFLHAYSINFRSATGYKTITAPLDNFFLKLLQHLNLNADDLLKTIKTST